MLSLSSLKRRLVRWIRRKLGVDDYRSVELEDGTEVRIYSRKVEVDEGSEDSETAGDEVDVSDLNGRESVARGDDGKSMREAGYENMSESKIAEKATRNGMVFSDVMNDPSLVGASSDVEAVAELAVSDSGWASFVDFDADLGVDPGEVDAASDSDVSADESRHGSSGEESPDYDAGGDHGVGASGVNPGEGSGSDAGVETGVSIDTGSGEISGGNAVGSGDGGSGSGGGSGDGGVFGGNSV